MSAQRLPANWLAAEFSADVQAPTGRTNGSRKPEHGSTGRVLYTCRQCTDAPTFTSNFQAKRHASTPSHRRRYTPVPIPSPLPLRGSLLGSRSFLAPASPSTSGARMDLVPPEASEYNSSDRESDQENSHAPEVEREERPAAGIAIPLYSSPPWQEDDWRAKGYGAAGAWLVEDSTGVDVAHPELDGRMAGEPLWDLPTSDSGSEYGGESDDCASFSDDDTARSSASDSDGMEDELERLALLMKRSREGEPTPDAARRSWDPYPNAAYAILDIILNFPRHPMPDELLRIIIWGVQQLGVKGVPSLAAFRKFQTVLQGSETFAKARACISVLGNHFTINDILRSIRLDMSNPLVRPHLAFYPEEPLAGTSELRHSSKWLWELPDCALTPMWISPEGEHFYVMEVALLQNGQYVLPLRWFLSAGMMQMFYYPVYETEMTTTQAGLEVDSSTRLRGPAASLHVALPKLRDGAEGGLKVAEVTQRKFSPATDNPWRARAGGRPCYKYFILFGGDDVSGNRSKSWNKHWAYYYCAAGLPLECLNQEYFVHFVSSSQHAGPVEQLAAITERLRSVKDTGIVCFDCTSAGSDANPRNEECLIIPDLFVGTGDGPWQSELSSHSGDVRPCRFCLMGGNVKERSSDNGFLAIMKPGEQRTPQQTLRQIRADLDTATHARQGTALSNTQQATGTVDSLAQTVIETLVEEGKALFDERTDAGGKRHTNADIHVRLLARRNDLLANGDFINPLLTDEVFDPHQDTALGRLHLVLLGFAKYFWSASLPATGRKLTVTEKAALDRAEAILLSLSQDGLGDRSVRADYVMRYRGSLVGRHLHSITQLAVFLFGHTASAVLVRVWVSLGRLCAMLFTGTIQDIPTFTHRLEIVIDDFFDAVTQFNPTWVMYKSKFHHLAHTARFIERFGPMGLYAEDRFEKFHAVWQNSSVFSNHHSASRDSATHFNGIDATKHILSGGFFWWQGAMVRAGSEVRTLFRDQPSIQERFGLRTGRVRSIGTTVVSSKAARRAWDTIPGMLALPGLDAVWPRESRNPSHAFYRQAKSVVTARGDTCKPGMFTWVSSPHPGVARIKAIYSRDDGLSRGSSPATIVHVELFNITQRHSTVECPCLVANSAFLLGAEEVMFTVNVQHDCFKHRCPQTGEQTRVQERQTTNLRANTVTHLDDTDFILNLFILHHYDELCGLLDPKFLGPAEERGAEERQKIRLAAASVLRTQIQTRETTKGAVRKARASAKKTKERVHDSPDAMVAEDLPESASSEGEADAEDAVEGAGQQVRRKRKAGTSEQDGEPAAQGTSRRKASTKKPRRQAGRRGGGGVMQESSAGQMTIG